jgi:hypothetical protein
MTPVAPRTRPLRQKRIEKTHIRSSPCRPGANCRNCCSLAAAAGSGTPSNRTETHLTLARWHLLTELRRFAKPIGQIEDVALRSASLVFAASSKQRAARARYSSELLAVASARQRLANADTHGQ